MATAGAMIPKTKGSRGAAVAVIISYLIIVLAPMMLAWLFFPTVPRPFLRLLGMMCAMVAMPILILQAVTAARLRPISRHFGLDMVLRFHKGMAAFALVLLLCHPVLIAAASGRWSLITHFNQPWPFLLGKVALLLMVIQGVTSLFQRRLLAFEKWRIIHNQAVLIWLLGWTHSFMLGEDLKLMPLRILWVIAGLAVFGFYLYHKVYVPKVTARHAWSVAEVRQETHSVWTLTFQPPPDVAHFPYWPGQFRYVSLWRPGRPFNNEEHHFTISSSPTQPGRHASTIKESGDFTRTIGQTRPGDKARIQGAYGRFSHVFYPEEKNLVFIAGGIGITPFMSMLRYMRDMHQDLNVLLLYANKTEGDIVFREELAQIEAGPTPHLKTIHVLSEPDARWQGDKGQIDRPILERFCGPVAGKAFYLCGPTGLMDKAEAALRGMRVPVDLIHSERFYL